MVSTGEMPILKVLSALLVYPGDDHVAIAAEMRAIAENEASLDLSLRGALCRLIDEYSNKDMFDLQERYVECFDRSRSLSLHMFEHVHGDSRDRGQAMVDLAGMYERNGLTLTSHELPDFLPAILEFCATLPAKEAVSVLSQTAHILCAIAGRLDQKASPYAPIFTALVTLSGGASAGDQTPSAEAESDTDNFAMLDKTWEDSAVTFGAGPDGQGACGADTMAARLRYGRRAMPIVREDVGVSSRPPAFES
jgi:nitrate reductase delta subunit